MGKRLTLAQWMRNYINNDSRYKKNSILEKDLMDSMLMELYEISKGTKNDSNFKPIFDLWQVNTTIDKECEEMAQTNP